MNTSTVYRTNYPVCLSNNKDLQLAGVSLRYLHIENLPSLLTIYELEKPAILAINEINKIILEIENENLSDYSIKGQFSLALAYFETMLNDLMIKNLQFFPQKITLLKRKSGESRRESKEISVSQEIINNGSVIETIIEHEIQKIGYENIETILGCFLNIFSIEGRVAIENMDQLIEIKETRNLLIHNNLLVNDAYLRKTKSIKRALKAKKYIEIDKNYALESLTLISKITEDIVSELRNKYGKFTLLSMLKKLWRYTFKFEGIKFEEFCTLNYDKDIYDGPFNFPNWISSSEVTFMEFWQAQRTSTPINRPSLCHLDSENIKKLAFLVEVFGQLRFPHWSRDFEDLDLMEN